MTKVRCEFEGIQIKKRKENQLIIVTKNVGVTYKLHQSEESNFVFFLIVV